VSVLAESAVDKGVDLGDFRVESDHRFRQPDDHVGGEPLAGQGRVLRCGSLDRGCRDGSGVADFPVAQPRFQPGLPDPPQRVGRLVTGQQSEGGFAGAVIESPLEGREIVQQLRSQPVDRSGAIADQVGAASGQDPMPLS
jgi:hypothetical protein